MAQQRNQTRPEGEAGANWAVCLSCGRQAEHINEIPHRKDCPMRKEKEKSDAR